LPRDPYAREREIALSLGGAVAGVDEVGRGPLAGPVVAAAVVLPESVEVVGLADSKTLSRARREQLCGELLVVAQVGIGWATTREIDRVNVLQATHLAMARAVRRLPSPPAHLLVDGRPVPGLPVEHTAVVKGDSKCACISAASIVAKVVRDRFMAALGRRFPAYGFERNMGYASADHRAALAECGPCPHHRRSFFPVAQTAQGSLF
jgi:ribonuclease HII